MRNQPPARLAILGYGYWGPNQVRAFCQLLGQEHLVVCDPDPGRRALAGHDHPGIHVIGDWRQILADDSVDAVSLCTPAGQHADLGRRFLATGRHVLVEKPLATSSRDGQNLVDLAQQQVRVLMAGHLFLFHPAVRALRRLIEAGELGEVRYITSIRSSLGPRVRSEVSVIWDYLIHDAYIVPFLLGRAPQAVRADGGTWLQAGATDAVFATLDFGGGTLAHVQSSWYHPVKERRMIVVGSRQMAVWDENAGSKLAICKRGYAACEGVDSWGNQGLRLFDEGEEPVALEQTEPLRAECQHFLECIATGQQPLSSGRQALGTLRLLEAIDQSLQSGGDMVVML